MGTNKYFNFYNSRAEQRLYEDLIIESIDIYGIDALYIPRKQDNIGPIYKDDFLSYFDDYYDIEIWMKNIDSFDGEGEIFRKFGVDVKDQATFVTSRSRFIERFDQAQEYQYGLDFTARPKEGDLIYLRFDAYNEEFLWEVRYVKDDTIFYTHGALYVFEMQCELYPWSHEEFETGVPGLDELEKIYDHSIDLYLVNNDAPSFQEDEIIYQGTSYPDNINAEAVINFAKSQKVLGIRDIKGEFIDGELVYGQASGTTARLESHNDQEATNQILDQNVEIQTEADDIIDFSEDNPFSEGEF